MYLPLEYQWRPTSHDGITNGAGGLVLSPFLSVSVLGVTVPAQRQTLLLEEYVITLVPYYLDV